MDSEHHIDFFIVIANRKKKNEIVAFLLQNGARVINTVYGKSSVKASSVQDAFGFVPEENKIIVTCLLLSEKSDSLLESLNKDFGFSKPNTGIAFTIPVAGLSY